LHIFIRYLAEFDSAGLNARKRRLTFAKLTEKECFNFPVAIHYLIEIIIDFNFLIRKLCDR